MSTPRIQLWDNVRFFLMFLVVVGHLVGDYIKDSGTFAAMFLFIYTFHMPLFFFISGLFHKNKNIGSKVISYLSIYLLLKIMVFLIRLAFGKKAVFQLFTESSFAWFMFALAVFVLITYLLRNVNMHYVLLFALVVGCFCNYSSELGDFLCLSRILVFYPYYVMGVIADRTHMEAMCRRTVFRFGALLILLIWAGICLRFHEQLDPFRHLLTGRNAFSDALGNAGAIYRFLHYMLASLLSFSFILVTPPSSLGVITAWGRRTLQIYFWHRPILLILSYARITPRILSYGTVGKIGWMLFGVFLTVVCALPILRQPTDWILKASLPQKTEPTDLPSTPK